MESELLGKTFVGIWKNEDGTLEHSGSIFLNPDGSARLDIVNFSSIILSMNEKLLNVVYGDFTETSSLNAYTIILINGSHSKSVFGGGYNYSFKYQFALIGKGDVNLQNGLEFHTIMLSSESLQKSMVTDDIVVNRKNNGNIDYLSNFSKEYPLYSDEELKLYLWWRIRFPLGNSSEITIKKHGWLNIEFSAPKSFDACLKTKNSFEQFFTILSKNMVSFDLFELRSGEVNFSVFGIKEKYNHGLNSYDLNFLVRNSSQLFVNWFNLCTRIGFALENFHIAYVEKGVPIRNEFLAFCFSLELFHREFFKRTESYSEKRLKQISGILEKLKGTSHYEWFRTQVAEKQREISFQDRIAELITGSNVKIQPDEVKGFAKKVRATRVKFVHMNDKNEDCFTDEELKKNIQLISEVFLSVVNNKLVIDTDSNNESYRNTTLLILDEQTKIKD